MICVDIGFKNTLLPLSNEGVKGLPLCHVGCKMYTENHRGLERLDAVANSDRPPQGRPGDAEPRRALCEGETLVNERRQDLELQVRPKRYHQVLVVAYVEPV